MRETFVEVDLLHQKKCTSSDVPNKYDVNTILAPGKSPGGIQEGSQQPIVDFDLISRQNPTLRSQCIVF